MNILTRLGTALYDTHGKYCEDIVNAGYDLDNYYDEKRAWGDLDRAIAMALFIRGARSYDEYVTMFDRVKQGHDALVSKSLFARLTGIYAKDKTQTQRTREYRQRLTDELDALRESTAKSWIDSHIDEAQQYITDTTVVK